VSTTFRGVFSEVFGGILTMRGFAPFADLAKHSQPNGAYQRKPNSEHQAEIEKFYRNKHDLFFPELVFSMPLDQISLDGGKYQFSSGEPGVKITVTGTRTASTLERVNLVLPEVQDGKGLLQRIDGNHRLLAYENLHDTEFDRYYVPFCIVLLRKDQALTTEKALFFNINSKSRPLTSEEIYRSIIDDEIGFPDEVLERDFGLEFVISRQTRQGLNFTYLYNLRGVFGQQIGQDDTRCSVLIESLKDIKDEQLPLPDAEKLLLAIQAINTAYTDERLSLSKSAVLFSAFLYFELHGGTLNRQFIQWVLANHLYELQVINAADIIRIFEKVAKSRKQQIFVSMWFNEKTKANFEAIKAAVDDINQAYTQDIKLRKIRIDQFDTGFSYEINAEILRLIDESGLLIADLTGGNKNVYHEIGFLMGLNQGRGLPDENFLLLHNDGIGETAKDVGFNLNHIKQIRVSDTNSLREDLKKQIAIYYGLEAGV